MLEARNKFQKHDEARAAQRNASQISRADAVTIRDEQRKKWTSHNRSQGQGGLLLDQKTLAAKVAAVADRNKAQPTNWLPSAATLEALTEMWLQRNPQFYQSQFNAISMKNFLAKAVNENKITPSLELLDAAFEWLSKNSYLELDPRIPRKRGDVARSAVARVFEYTTSEEAEQFEQERMTEAMENRAREDASNRALPLDELRRRAQTARGVVSRESLRVFQG
jgi:hypothetical protein